jgi:hypothetical protein
MQEERNFQTDLPLIINHAILIGQSIKGIPIPKDDDSLRFIEPLLKKTLNHIISAYNLYGGIKFVYERKQYNTVDFSSIAVLTRAAIESYLTFHYLYISSNDKSEKRFRFLRWDLAGYIERESFPIPDYDIQMKKAAEEILSEEKILKYKVYNELKDTDEFKRLDNKFKHKIFDTSNWRIEKGWITLAKEANLAPIRFKHIYNFLCSFSHTGRLGIIQIQQIKGYSEEKLFSDVFHQINAIILSRQLKEFVTLLPECQAVYESNSEAIIAIEYWIKENYTI